MDLAERDLRLVSIAEACGELRIGRANLYTLIDAGELTRVHIGARAFITKESINRFLGRIFAEAEIEQEAKERTAASID